MDKNYLMINKATNVVDNVISWSGDTNTWQPPSDYLLLVQETTPVMYWDEVVVEGVIVDWILKETVGCASIGFTWNGTACVTNEPKPDIPPPPAPTPDSNPTV